jgi:hypothetical protein
MKRLALLLLVLISSTVWSIPAHAQREPTTVWNGREAKKAAKQQQQYSKRQAKKQRKAAKNYQKAQRKTSRQNRHK